LFLIKCNKLIGQQQGHPLSRTNPSESQDIAQLPWQTRKTSGPGRVVVCSSSKPSTSGTV